MAETEELVHVARRLDKFIGQVKKTFDTRPVQRDHSRYTAAANEDPVLQIYKPYLDKLSPDERGQLDSLVKKMSGAV